MASWTGPTSRRSRVLETEAQNRSRTAAGRQQGSLPAERKGEEERLSFGEGCFVFFSFSFCFAYFWVVSMLLAFHFFFMRGTGRDTPLGLHRNKVLDPVAGKRKHRRTLERGHTCSRMHKSTCLRSILTVKARRSVLGRQGQGRRRRPGQIRTHRFADGSLRTGWARRLSLQGRPQRQT